MQLIKNNLSKKQADVFLEQERKRLFAPSKGIMCKCNKCGGLGFAGDETMLDSKGYLKDMKCPCGGKIKKL